MSKGEDFMKSYQSIEWVEGSLRMLDQRVLPHRVTYLMLRDYREVITAIREMAVRGAPAIGAAGAYGLALAAFGPSAKDAEDLHERLAVAAAELRKARPTAVNLSWAVDRVMRKVKEVMTGSLDEMRKVVLEEAQAIAREDIRTNQLIGRNALELVPKKAVFIHHCNTGALATVDYGTALGIIRTAHEHGKEVFVYVDETRPRLQGARLTTWELQQLGIPHAVIVDGASGHVMKHRQVDLVTVGCDRVAANGDTANKIGTYNLALAAGAHGVPFYVAAPTSTIDLSLKSGEVIEIEERDPKEITRPGNEVITPEGTLVYNPAFDITPAAYITAFITESGVAYPPFKDSLQEMVTRAKQIHSPV